MSPVGALYRGLLRLLPAAVRRRHGAELEAAWRQLLAEAPWWKRPWIALRSCFDVLVNAVRLRLRPRRVRREPPWRTFEMNALVRDTGQAVRALTRNFSFTVVAVVTLALGIGANTAIFSVVNGVLLQPLPYRDPERMAMIWHDLGNGAQSLPVMHALDFFDYQERVESFEEMALAIGRQMILSWDGEQQRLDVARVSSNFFSFFGVDPIRGRHIRPDEDVVGGARVALLSHGLWQRRFGGDPGLVGRVIELQGEQYEVIGILPEDFELLLPPEAFLLRDADVWLPVQFDPRNPRPRNFTTYTAFARLGPGVTFDTAQREVDRVVLDLRAEHAEHEASNLKARVIPLHHDIVKQVRQSLILLLAAVGFVLLIACANVAHLFLARGQVRRRELALRAALGAGRMRLSMQVLQEAFLVAVMGTGLGLLLADGILRGLAALAPPGLPRLADVQLDASVLLFAAGVCVATALIFGFLPALQGFKTDVAAALADGQRSGQGAGQARLRRFLIVAEVALSLLLLVGAGLMVRSFVRLQQVDPGFQPEHLLTWQLTLPRDPYADFRLRAPLVDELRREIESLAEVREVSVVSQLPLTGSGPLQPYAYDEETASNWESVTADRRSVAPGFVAAMGATLLAGREFDSRDVTGGRRVILIDDTLAERAFGGDAVGRQLQLEPNEADNRWAEVVGVVRHLRLHDLTRATLPQIWVPYAQSSTRSFHVCARTTGSSTAAAAEIRRAIVAVEPRVAIDELVPMGRLVGRAQGQARLSLLLMGAFAVLAIVMASVGIYGVLAYSISQRTREFGIRMALGEGPAAIQRAIIRQGMKLVGLSLAIGLLAALILSRFMSGLIYGVDTRDPLTYAAVAVLLTAVALAACWVPARRATRVDPLEALRTE